MTASLPKWRFSLVHVALAFAAGLLLAWSPSPSSRPNCSNAKPAAGSNRRSSGSSTSSGQDPWHDAPANISIKMQVPLWAGCAQPPCQYGTSTKGDASPKVRKTSQYYEDTWLWRHLFYCKRNGFYLEFGALDGVWLSNTYWLHHAAGWRGLLIEANPDHYSNLTRNRPGDILVNAAVCSEFRNMHWVSNKAVGGIWEFMAEEFKELRHPGVTIDQLDTMPCVPLMYLLDRFGVQHIDFWSLDVEGGELEVLRAVDFSRLSIGVMVVELDGLNPEKDQEVTDILLGAGFEAVPHAPVPKGQEPPKGHKNTFFIHRSYRDQLRSMPDVSRIES